MINTCLYYSIVGHIRIARSFLYFLTHLFILFCMTCHDTYGEVRGQPPGLSSTHTPHASSREQT